LEEPLKTGLTVLYINDLLFRKFKIFYNSNLQLKQDNLQTKGIVNSSDYNKQILTRANKHTSVSLY